MVVKQELDGDLTEVGHHGVDDVFVSGMGMRVDGQLRIRATDGW